MPIGMMLVLIISIAGILALFIVWHELDRVERVRRNSHNGKHS